MKLIQMIECMKKNDSLMKKGFYVFLFIIVVFDVVIPREESHYFVDTFFTFWTLFTLAGCFLLIKVSKGIAHLFLAKDEDYYE
jgi:hypothetical protein